MTIKIPDFNAAEVDVPSYTLLSGDEAPQHQLIDKNNFVAIVEKMFSGLTMVDVFRSKVDSGDAYTATENLSLATASSIYLLTVPDTLKWPHLSLDIAAQGELLVELFEGSTHTGGTLIPAVNLNRNVVNPAGMSITSGASGGGDGTLLFSRYSGSTGTNRKADLAGSAELDIATILKQSTIYALKVTTFATTIVSTRLNWFEHESVN